MKECFQEKKEGSRIRQGNKSKDVVSAGDELQCNLGLAPPGGKKGGEDGTVGDILF